MKGDVHQVWAKSNSTAWVETRTYLCGTCLEACSRASHIQEPSCGNTPPETLLGYLIQAGGGVSHLPVYHVHDTGAVYAAHEDGRAVPLGTLTAEWFPAYTASWFPLQLKLGPKPMSWWREQIRTVNDCYRVQEQLQAMPPIDARDQVPCTGKAGCRHWATHRHDGSPLCEDCAVMAVGGY